jgi:hypothetical protein
MKKGENALRSRFRPWRSGWTAGVILSLITALLLGIAGCGPDNGGIDYPRRPPIETQTWFFDIWGTAADNIYVVGQPGLILHYDGAWTQMSVPTNQPLVCIYGNAPNDIYVCGHKGTILRSTGGGWTAMNSGTKKNLYGIGKFKDGRIYCVGDDWTILRLDGANWVAAPKVIVRRNPEGTAIIDTLKQNEGDELYLSSVSHYGLGGKNGVILMEDPAASWQIKFVAGGEWVTAAWSDPASVPNNRVTTDEGRVYRLQQEQNIFSWLELINRPTFDTIYDIWTADQDLFYFVTQAGDIVTRNEAGQTARVYDGSLMLYGIWGTDVNNIYAVGIEGTVLHYQDGAWERLDLGISLKSQQIQPLVDKFGRPLD